MVCVNAYGKFENFDVFSKFLCYMKSVFTQVKMYIF